MRSRQRPIIIVKRKIVEESTPTPPVTIPDLTFYTGNSLCKNMAEVNANFLLKHIVEITNGNLDSMFENALITSFSIDHNINCNNIASAQKMFKGCTSLVSVEGSTGVMQGSKVYTYAHMFYGCMALKKVDFSVFEFNTNTTYAGSAEAMFSGCSALEEVLNLHFDSISTFTNTFTGCTALKRLTFAQGTSFGGVSSNAVTLNLSPLTALTDAAVAEMAESLGANESGYVRKVQFASAVKAALSEETKAILTDKGYTIA